MSPTAASDPGGDSLIDAWSRALLALWAAADELPRLFAPELLAAAVERGLFRPQEEEALVQSFARCLTVRAGLWELTHEIASALDGSLDKIHTREQRQSFVLAYSAACLIARLDRFLVDEVGHDAIVRAKLDEGQTSHRIPRKAWTALFTSLADPEQGLLMYQARQWARGQADWLDHELADDPRIGPFWRRRRELEKALYPSKRSFLRVMARQTLHSLTRRGRSAGHRVSFAVLEAGGRLASELGDPFREPRIPGALARGLASLLRPGDVLITRHDGAFTNLFLPGYWPHAALYVGPATEREALGVELDEQRRRRWQGDRDVLEALKDGVLFRPLHQTLAVDAVVVLRPRLSRAELGLALTRVACHEGKPYNFNFDFFSADRLVCTEVIYRAYDGLGDIHLELTERAGRPTLAAEDLLRLALADRHFEVIAIAGSPTCETQVVAGVAAREHLAASLAVA